MSIITESTAQAIKIHLDQPDPYDWLRDKNWPDVTNPNIINFLKDWNNQIKSHISDEIQEIIFNELKNKIQEKDYTVPIKREDYYYYSYINQGQDYWTIARKKDSLDNTEEILLDINGLSEGHSYFDVGSYTMSSDHKMILYSVDKNGSERYNVYVKNIEKNEVIDSKVTDVMGATLIWDEKSEGFFYIPCGEFWRSDRVFYHKLGDEKTSDRLVYQEKDPTFSVDVIKSNSREVIFFQSKSSNSTEYHFINSTDPSEKPTVIEPRLDGHKYHPTHHGDHFYIVTNDTGPNLRVVKTLVQKPSKSNWEEYIKMSEEIIEGLFAESLFAHQEHFVMDVNNNGLHKLKIIKIKDKSTQEVTLSDPCYSIQRVNTPFDYNSVLYKYSSPKKPQSVIELDLITNKTKVLKIQEIPSGFDPNEYAIERLWATADDGVKIPISVLYRRTIKLDGSAPLYMYGYGSYGIPIEAGFRSSIFSLVDRGFIYAIAHIRGGGEFGQSWHDAAKLLTKKKTFEDFIACAEHLIKENYTRAKNIVIHGGSAGGMLIGACVNMRPDLFHAAIAEVPFVDVLNTMLDDSLPLTPLEFKEWGNPKAQQYYDYIKSYCPYSNIKRQDYPHILAIAGLNDPRVTYWEAAKWVASLQNMKTDNNLLLLKTDMNAGHAGSSGRFDHLKDIATIFSFILKVFDNK